jgi:hypothetical protein
MRLRFECWLLAVALFGGAGCSSDTQKRQSGSGANGAEPVMASSGGSSGGGGSGGHSVSANGGAPVVQIGGSAGRDVSAGTAGVESCASAHAEAELLPVYLAFAFDVSGSMGKGDKPWHDRTLKWDPVVAAIRGFLEDPSASGLRASMTVFPADGGEDARCDDASYLEPDVAMTELPSAEFGQALDAIGADEWRGGTPTLHVLRGVRAYVDERRAAAPGKYAAVLVTDGYPQDCDDDEISALAELVSGAAAELPTYVVGVANPPLDDAPDTVSDLEQIAVAGGTGHAYLIDTGDPALTTGRFREAIDAIRGSAIACELTIPAPPDGRAFDKESVSVRYRSGTDAQALAYEANCAADGAWHYDSPADPARIVLCDSACATLQADPRARLEVEFGCQRVLHIPE